MVGYAVVAIPMYTGVELTVTQAEQVHAWVATKWGLGSLHPTLIDQLAEQVFGKASCTGLLLLPGALCGPNGV